MSRFLYLLIVCALIFNRNAYAGQAEWVSANIDISDNDFTCMAIDPQRPGTLYLGTEDYLYRSMDNGLSWDTIFSCRVEDRGLNDIFVSDDSVLYIATEEGSYLSRDHGKSWDDIFGETIFKNKPAKSVVLGNDKENFYLLTNGNLYKIKADDFSWQKIYNTSTEIGESESIDEEYLDEETVVLKGLTIDGVNNVYLSTNRGLLKSADAGITWQRVDELGLISNDINFCLPSKVERNKIYTATSAGVFEYDTSENKWISIYKGLESNDVRYLSFNSLAESFIYCLTKNNVYKTIKSTKDVETIYADFRNEPSIREVHEMAINYAEVSPDKIKRWRKQAGMKAVFPKISFGFDRDMDTNINIDRGGTNDPDLFIFGPDSESWNWDLSLSWDLSDLIYNETQTSIDVRGKLMAQLREDILNEVTRVYFERRRLLLKTVQSQSETHRENVEEKLRIEELTALLDAFTGGEFSDAIETRGL
ncbi:MAG: hypothetical protein HQ579_09255 [Candidatus Omnitrophica bacterium]|nr:hypothetical protein [Candidatus Omnitrophota bacterium]